MADEPSNAAASADDDAVEATTPPSVTAENQAVKSMSSGANDDRFSLRIKTEFLLTARDPSLPPLSDAEAAKKTGGGGPKKKRMRKMDASSQGPKICSSVVRGTTCPFGDNCKYPHDLEEYMRHRSPDLPNLDCPNYQLYGHCPFGVACRMGSQHTTKQGANVSKDTVTEPPPTLNSLPRDVQEQLRRHRYPFVCQRHRDVKANSKSERKQLQSEPSPDYTPLPAKEVKLIDFSNKVGNRVLVPEYALPTYPSSDALLSLSACRPCSNP